MIVENLPVSEKIDERQELKSGKTLPPQKIRESDYQSLSLEKVSYDSFAWLFSLSPYKGVITSSGGESFNSQTKPFINGFFWELMTVGESGRHLPVFCNIFIQQQRRETADYLVQWSVPIAISRTIQSSPPPYSGFGLAPTNLTIFCEFSFGFIEKL